jgi:hypothetical protein
LEWKRKLYNLYYVYYCIIMPGRAANTMFYNFLLWQINQHCLYLFHNINVIESTNSTPRHSICWLLTDSLYSQTFPIQKIKQIKFQLYSIFDILVHTMFYNFLLWQINQHCLYLFHNINVIESTNSTPRHSICYYFYSAFFTFIFFVVYKIILILPFVSLFQVYMCWSSSSHIVFST